MGKLVKSEGQRPRIPHRKKPDGERWRAPNKKQPAQPVPVWRNVLRNVWKRAEEFHGFFGEVPWFWVTSNGSPCCVRCGTRLTSEQARNLFPAGSYLRVGSCSDCLGEVLEELKNENREAKEQAS